METSAGEPLISTRPFAVTKCSAWLVSNEYPISQAPSPVILKPATISYRTLAVVSVQAAQKKNTRCTKTLCSQYYGKTKETCRNGQLGSTTGGQWDATSPWLLQCSRLLLQLIKLNGTQILSRTPLDEGSNRRRDFYLPTHNTHKRQASNQWRDSKPQYQNIRCRRPTL